MDQGTTKIVCVGDGTVGKTCLLLRYTQNEFSESYVPTVFDNQNIDVVVDETSVSIECVDTAGQEGYDSLRSMSYPGTNVVMICFACDNGDSLSNVEEKWIPELEREFRKINESMPQIILAANKSDLVGGEEWDEWRAGANALAVRIGAFNGRIYENSAMEGIGVEEIFQDAVRAALSAASPNSEGCCNVQ